MEIPMDRCKWDTPVYTNNTHTPLTDSLVKKTQKPTNGLELNLVYKL